MDASSISWDYPSPVYKYLISDGNRYECGPHNLKLYCMTCKKGEEKNVKLNRCSRCKVVYYCNQECQKQDFARHQKECKDYAKCMKIVNEQRELLNNSTDADDPFGPPEHPFFWEIFDKRDFMRASLALTKKQMSFALMSNMLKMWELCLNNSLELLRLSRNDNMGVRYCVPFLLLRVNRDDDAFSFCKYWILDIKVGIDTEKHYQSKKGDWLYERKKNIRFDKIDEKYFESMSTAFALAMCLIKIRLVDYTRKVQKEIEDIGLETNGVGSIVQSFMHTKVDLVYENKTVERLLDYIHKSNPTVLPAILNPGPLLNQESPSMYCSGNPSEAYEIVFNARIAGFHKNVLAESLLTQRFGTKPSYPYEIDSY